MSDDAGEAGSGTEASGTEASDTEATGDRDLESMEIITAAMQEDGTIVIDDLVAEVDPEGRVVATDERVEIDLPDGTVIVGETFSVADEDGDLVAIDEETTIFGPDDGGADS